MRVWNCPQWLRAYLRGAYLRIYGNEVYFNFCVIAQRLKQRQYMASGIFGTGVWGHFGSPLGSRGGALEKFSNKNKYIFAKSIYMFGLLMVVRSQLFSFLACAKTKTTEYDSATIDTQ